MPREIFLGKKTDVSKYIGLYVLGSQTRSIAWLAYNLLTLCCKLSCLQHKHDVLVLVTTTCILDPLTMDFFFPSSTYLLFVFLFSRGICYRALVVPRFYILIKVILLPSCSVVDQTPGSLCFHQVGKETSALSVTVETLWSNYKRWWNVIRIDKKWSVGDEPVGHHNGLTVKSRSGQRSSQHGNGMLLWHHNGQSNFQGS